MSPGLLPGLSATPPKPHHTAPHHTHTKHSTPRHHTTPHHTIPYHTLHGFLLMRARGWDPKQGSLGPHLACDQIWSAGVSPRTTPKTGKIHFWAFSARFMPWAAAKFLQVPQTPPKPSKWRISRGNRVKPPNVRRQSKKVAQRERGFDEPRNSRKLADGAELRPEQFFLVGSLTNKTGPQLTKRPSAPYLGS